MLTLDLDDVSRSGSDLFSPDEIAADNHWLGDRVSATACVNLVARRKRLIFAGIEPL